MPEMDTPMIGNHPPTTGSRYDVAIIGGGIGGSCAAISLAKRGAKVLVLEAGEFPRQKVCGEFLSPESKAIFARLGVLQRIVDAGASEVQAARVVTRSGRALNLPLPQPALSLSRFRLDQILATAAHKADAEVLCNTRVREMTKDADGFSIATSQGDFRARLVLDAAGRHASWRSNTAATSGKEESRTKYVGLKAHFTGGNFPVGIVELHTWRGGYCGLVQVEGGVHNVCLLARYNSLCGRSPDEFWTWLLQHLPELRARMQSAQITTPWLATGNIVFEQSTPVAENIWNCGDAAGFIHPLAGDGMAMAARSGELAAAILTSYLRGEISQEIASELYSAAWKREFEVRLHWAGWFQKLLIDSQLISPALSLLSCLPALSQFAVRATRG